MKKTNIVRVDFKLSGLDTGKPYYTQHLPEAKGLLPSWAQRRVWDHCGRYTLPIARGMLSEGKLKSVIDTFQRM